MNGMSVFKDREATTRVTIGYYEDKRDGEMGSTNIPRRRNTEND
ncbi:MAG: hypothetical protein A4E63_01031 [Syntrophorhabdus sp. PtaU1.Bin050]|nr:MAG: hypothetical protein A4E63_01031 [Syntrophorhabdus sp. PtaU1.Bin050]